ncbi:MAG TPA: hypothetical protein VMT37_10670 [Solirubrobacterales bacterium]|nr:hypothetical protein [Solirubrobacterales bacterium]
MTSKIRSIRVSPAMIVSCVALFLALTGSALAVGIAKNSVRSPQIVDGTVRTVDLHNGSVGTEKIHPAAVGKDQLAENSVDSLKVENESLTGSDIADNTITGADVAPDSIRASDLGPATIRTSASQAIAAGANGSVSVQCAEGEQMLSGGGQPGNFGVEMTSSIPSGNGWLYQAKNNSGAASTIKAFVVCLLQ